MTATITHIQKDKDGNIIELGFSEGMSEAQVREAFPEFDLDAYIESDQKPVIIHNTTR
jgi:hypothetical protein